MGGSLPLRDAILLHRIMLFGWYKALAAGLVALLGLPSSWIEGSLDTSSPTWGVDIKLSYYGISIG